MLTNAAHGQHVISNTVTNCLEKFQALMQNYNYYSSHQQIPGTFLRYFVFVFLFFVEVIPLCYVNNK